MLISLRFCMYFHHTYYDIPEIFELYLDDISEKEYYYV